MNKVVDKNFDNDIKWLNEDLTHRYVMRSRHKHDWPKENKRNWKYEQASKYVKIMDRKFQMGYKYLCEILHGPEVLNLGI